MDFYFDSSAAIGVPLYELYSKNALILIRNIKQDKSISNFERFNKRLKISWGLRIEFTDNLAITQATTRNCYALMLKLSDLWFAFEHLGNAVTDIFPKDKDPKSKVDFYTDDTLSILKFDKITKNFNSLLWEHVLHRSPWRRDMYPYFSYLKNNTKGGVAARISETIDYIKKKQELSERHLFSLAYGIRNLYIHVGVSAALGGRNYEVKEYFYMVLYDTLILFSLQLGNVYSERKFITLNS